MKKAIVGILVLVLVVLGVQQIISNPGATPEPKGKGEGENQFNSYWFAGEAEICTYELKQARYGEIRPGEAVMVFVTEGYSKDKLLKMDKPDPTGNEKIQVLKLNYTKQFITGMYPYSLMLSTFKPINNDQHPNTMKVTAGMQEWCGHTFSELSLRKGKYDVMLNSYFESEGVQNHQFETVFLEDEIFTTIRINPELLPVGEFEMLPSFFYQRLSHDEIKPERVGAARTAMEIHEDWMSMAEDVMQYVVAFTESERTLVVYYDNNFPYKILGWEETYMDGYGPSRAELTTTAILKADMKSDYWSKNKNKDINLRDKLKLATPYR